MRPPEEIADMIDKDTAARLPSMADTRRDWTDELRNWKKEIYNSAIEDAAKVASGYGGVDCTVSNKILTLKKP